MDPNPVADERAVSPVVAVALLIGITVLLAAAIGTAVFGLDTGSAEAPSVTLSFEVVGDSIEMTHEGGEPLDAAQVTVLDGDGAEVGGLDSDLTAGQSETIVTGLSGIDRISVVWEDPNGGATEILATFEL
jgi:flagellin-like protein